MKRGLVAVVAGALLALPAGVFAHSILLDATPKAGAVLTTPPARVALRFNNRIEKTLSRLTLIDSRRKRQPLVPATDGGPDQLTAPLPSPLRPDTYRLEWSVLSTDGHVVTGGYSFQIAP